MKNLSEYLNESINESKHIIGSAKKAGVTRAIDQECEAVAFEFCKRIGCKEPSTIYWVNNAKDAEQELGKQVVAIGGDSFELVDETKCPELDRILKSLNTILKPNSPAYTNYWTWYEDYQSFAMTGRGYIIASQPYTVGKVHIIGYELKTNGFTDGNLDGVSLRIFITHDDVI